MASQHGFITLHILSDIPYSNLNRDDTGTPKRTIAGGVERGLLSSQSIKRAIRKDYERKIKGITHETLEDSYRSRNLADLVADRAVEISGTEGSADLKRLRAAASKLVKSLVGGGKDSVTWLSVEEIEAAAALVADDEYLKKLEDPKAKIDFEDFVKSRGVTGSLAIAAFGRMFASATLFQTEAAIAVSPAISTHGSIIETDYFIAAEDYQTVEEGKEATGAGAGHLGISLYTSGIFYRSVTIDVKELWTNWTGRDSELREEFLKEFLTSIMYALPTGKKNSTAPYVEPLLIVAEQQSYRAAYSVTAPILNPGEDGFITKSVSMLKKQSELARKISPENYADRVVSGTAANAFVEDGEAPESVPSMVDTIISWLEEKLPKTAAEESDAVEEVAAVTVESTVEEAAPVEVFESSPETAFTESSFTLPIGPPKPLRLDPIEPEDRDSAGF